MRGKIFEVRRGMFAIDYLDGSGRRHRERIGSKRAAEDALRDRLLDVRRGTWRPARSRRDGTTFAELALESIEHRNAGGNLRESTRQTDLGRLSAVFLRIGAIPAAQVSRELLANLFLDLSKNGANPESPRPIQGPTLNRYRSVISSVFRWAIAVGRLDVNPLASVRRYKENKHRVKYLKAGEEERILAAIRGICPAREPEYELAVSSGMRLSEQNTLRWSDIDLVNGRAHARGKTGERAVELNERALRAIESLRRQAEARPGGPDEFLCPDTKASNQRYWPRWWASIAKAAGLNDWHWHDLRHEFASKLVMNGVSLIVVARLLGHTTTKMSERYAHLAPGFARDELLKAEASGGIVSPRASKGSRIELR
jgi:integrase